MGCVADLIAHRVRVKSGGLRAGLKRVQLGSAESAIHADSAQCRAASGIKRDLLTCRNVVAKEVIAGCISDPERSRGVAWIQRQCLQIAVRTELDLCDSTGRGHQLDLALARYKHAGGAVPGGKNSDRIERDAAAG